MGIASLSRWTASGGVALGLALLAAPSSANADATDAATLVHRRVYSQSDWNRLEPMAGNRQTSTDALARHVLPVSHRRYGFRGHFYRPYGFRFSLGYGYPYYGYRSYYYRYPRYYSFGYLARPYSYYTYRPYYYGHYGYYYPRSSLYWGGLSYYRPYYHFGYHRPYYGYYGYGYAPYYCD